MINKITIKNNVKIFNDQYVKKSKTNELTNVYNYLLSRSFDYFPEVINEDNQDIYYKYINDLEEPKEQKIIDLMNVLSLLHSKTTFYKEIDLDNYKYIYESITNQLNDIYNYYEILIGNTEQSIYMSPSSYLIARNISLIYSAINYAKDSLDRWYKLIENKRKVRVVTSHNNISLDHYLKSDKSYLISWDKASIDMPIYDLISIYKHHYLEFDFVDILKIYFNKYPLTEEEMLLFLTLISIPSKITYESSNYKTALNVRREIDYLYKTSELVKEYGIKQETNKQ